VSFKRNYQFSNNLPNAVSLVGVMFLFIFYLLSSSNLLLTEGASFVRLPKGAKSRPSWNADSVVVVMDKHANLYFYNQRISIYALGRELKRLTSRKDSGELLLVLKADRGIRYEQIASFSEMAEANGVSRIWLAAEAGLFDD
tara:strand:+ start:1279 stop:1704 length:426 start_codon:yes stop_codon:yes gene_type:complete